MRGLKGILSSYVRKNVKRILKYCLQFLAKCVKCVIYNYFLRSPVLIGRLVKRSGPLVMDLQNYPNN